MRGITAKISIVIVIYSLILTIVFLFGITYFQYSAASIIDASSNETYVYPLNDEEFMSIYQGNQQHLNSEHIVKSSNQYQEYAQAAMQQLLPFTILFCLFLIASSFLLWYILQTMQKKHTAMISMQFQHVKENESFDFQDESLNNAYQQIKQSFQANLEDYKRLNSYLSHEQKNAIAVLRTSMEVHHQKEYLPQLDYISNSIDDILTLSEQGDETEFHVVDVALCCARICDLYRKSYPLLEFDFDPDHPSEIKGKERWILRAVSNIVDNAIKYGCQKPIHVSVKHEHHSVIIIVKDQGIGMSDEQLNAIFHYHYRINELNRNGYGIGLSLVAHVCELCNGYAYVESTPNQGSSFYLSFPEHTGN